MLTIDTHEDWAEAAGVLEQAGAVPFRVAEGGAIEVLLVSSSRGYWLVPKGGVDPGHTLADTAVKETLEEAGAIGTLDLDPLGTFSYEKPSGGSCRVTLFALEVAEELDDWPELGERERRWLGLEHAARCVRWVEMGEVILRLREYVGGRAG